MKDLNYTSSTMIHKIFFAIALSIFSTRTCLSEVVYVSNEGSDDQTRLDAFDRNQPFATINFAISKALPGDDIVVLNGTYDGFEFGPSTLDAFDVEPGVFENLDLSIRSEVKWGAIIERNVFIANVGNVEISGFLFDGMPGFENNQLSVSDSANITIRDNRFDGNGADQIIVGQSDGVLLEWNILGDVARGFQRGTPGFASPAILVDLTSEKPINDQTFGVWIRNNTIYNSVSAIQVGRNLLAQINDDPSYGRPIMVENNLLLNIADTRAISLEIDNIRARYNTIVQFPGTDNNDFSPDSLIGVGVENRPVSQAYVYSNILQTINGSRAALGLTNVGSDVIAFNNLIDAPTLSTARNDEVRMMNWIADARLDGFIPRDDSPAIDNAFNPGDLFDLDVFGGSRQQGPAPDIGALEVR